MQSRDQVNLVSLPWFDTSMCAYQALPTIHIPYKPGNMEPPFSLTAQVSVL